MLPEGAGPAIAGGLVEGTVLADYRFDRAKGAGAAKDDTDAPPKQLEALIVAGDGELERPVAEAVVVAEAANRARDLQNRPANDLTPSALAERATAMEGELERLTPRSRVAAASSSAGWGRSRRSPRAPTRSPL